MFFAAQIPANCKCDWLPLNAAKTRFQMVKLRRKCPLHGGAMDTANLIPGPIADSGEVEMPHGEQ